MKISLLLFGLTFSQAQAVQEVHILTAENHCNVSFAEQQRLAIRDLLIAAELKCGTNLVPIQISKTKIIENHSCVHYRLGIQASAIFRCEVLSPDDQENQ